MEVGVSEVEVDAGLYNDVSVKDSPEVCQDSPTDVVVKPPSNVNSTGIIIGEVGEKTGRQVKRSIITCRTFI